MVILVLQFWKTKSRESGLKPLWLPQPKHLINASIKQQDLNGKTKSHVNAFSLVQMKEKKDLLKTFSTSLNFIVLYFQIKGDWEKAKSGDETKQTNKLCSAAHVDIYLQ